MNRGSEGWDKLSNRFESAVDTRRLLALCQHLGLSEKALRRLNIGWSREHQAWIFPMRNAQGPVRGIRLRHCDGRKLSVRGGREGLFIPTDLTGPLLLIAEGPTDTAALLDLGFAAIGRPSCRGAVQFTAEFVRAFGPEEVVIVADRDEAGLSGAEALASTLIVYARQLRSITPSDGIKDVRAWKAAGATAQDVNREIEAAPISKLGVAFRINEAH